MERVPVAGREGRAHGGVDGCVAHADDDATTRSPGAALPERFPVQKRVHDAAIAA